MPLADAVRRHCVAGWFPTHYYPDKGSRRMSVEDIIERLRQMEDRNATAREALHCLCGMEADKKEALTQEGEQAYADVLYAMSLAAIE